MFKYKGAALALSLQLMLLGYIQSMFWWSESGRSHSLELDQAIAEQEAENTRLRHRNKTLSLEIEALSQGGPAIEGRARMDLGMIKEGETLFLITE